MKEWFILIEGKQEGPYSLLDLRRHLRITPDTLVWKKGFPRWVAARFVIELKELFTDEGKTIPEESAKTPARRPDDVLALSHEPPHFIWIIILVVVLFYVFYKLQWL